MTLSDRPPFGGSAARSVAQGRPRFVSLRHPISAASMSVWSSFTIYLAFAASAFRCSAPPVRHVFQIRQDQPEFLIAQVLFRKAGHPLLGPNPNRAWISDQRAQTGIGEVFGWVHGQIQ